MTRASAMRPAISNTAAVPLELDLGRSGRVGRGFEERLGLKAPEAGHEAAGEEPNASVVLAHGVVEAPPLHGDAVLGAGQLGLQREEVLVGFQLGILLDGDEQAAESAAELALRRLQALHCRSIVECLWCELLAVGSRS